jgi:hypothetical protein
MFYIKQMRPNLILAKGASEATANEIAQEQARLRQAYLDRDSMEAQRGPLNEAHSKAGDNNSIDEAELADKLESLDGLITETTVLIGYLIS